jgi:hypothetical protein
MDSDNPFDIRIASNRDSVHVIVTKPLVDGSCTLYAETESFSYVLALISKPGSYRCPLKKGVKRVYLFDNLDDELILEYAVK